MTVSDETRRIIELLRIRHPAADGWATFIELREGTGYQSVQGIDFFAVHTWPSKDYKSIAYEIKVSRSDFRKELDNPNKRAFAERLSHECLFAVPQGLIRPDEVPEGWGLIVADAGGLKVVKHGTQRKDVKWPQTFMAAVARRQCDPPPTLPPVAWKIQGKEVSEEQLIEIAEHTLKTKIAVVRKEAYSDGKRKAQEEYENSPDRKNKEEIIKAVGEIFGVSPYHMTPQLIRIRAMDMNVGNPHVTDRAKLIEAHRLLGDLIGDKP